MRGLKLPAQRSLPRIFLVASFTDAWIETQKKQTIGFAIIVASFTDAWIETQKEKQRTPMLKVASFTDAWIETTDVHIHQRFR